MDRLGMELCGTQSLCRNAELPWVESNHPTPNPLEPFGTRQLLVEVRPGIKRLHHHASIDSLGILGQKFIPLGIIEGWSVPGYLLVVHNQGWGSSI